MKRLERLESRIERTLEWAKRFEPRWSRRHPLRLWLPIAVMISFVLVDNFRPADPRGRLALTPFEIDTDIGGLALLESLKKAHHFAYFALLGLFLRRIEGAGGRVRALAFVLTLSLLIEGQQAFMAGRTARPYDLVPNVLGFLAAWAYVDSRLKRGRGFGGEAPY